MLMKYFIYDGDFHNIAKLEKKKENKKILFLLKPHRDL